MDLLQYYGKDAGEIFRGASSREEGIAILEAILRGAVDGSAFPDGLPVDVKLKRARCLESPFYLATEILDPYYKEHFSEVHRRAMDEVLGPYLVGETVRIEGQNYDPLEYTGLGILFSRTTFKSTLLRMMAQWDALYRKLKLGEDARTMFAHHVIDKAVEHSEAIRTVARQHPEWRRCFPEFRANPEGDWDWKSKWRWPCFQNYQATEWSFVCYGETSSKVGGHYTARFVDDWVDQESVNTDAQLEDSFNDFAAMDHLRTRDRKHNPWVFAGTHYHHQDCYKRLENRGGWLIWRMPAHTGSPKVIFDICAIEDRTPEGRRKIEAKLRAVEAAPPGELKFPHLLPWRELYRTARTTGPQQYNCQMLLNPTPEGEQRFDREALEQSWVEEVPGPAACWVYVRCDPAISEKRDADETAILVGGVTWDGKRWMLDGWIGREKRPTEIVRKLFTFARKWQAKGYVVKNIGVESVQYQEALAEMCRSGVPEREPAYHGESVPMLTKPCAVRSITRSADKSKQTRILEMDGPVTRRELKFWTQNPVGRKTMLQFQNFPFDRFDALDAAHDFWEATMTPPPVLEEKSLLMPRELERILARRMRKDGGTVQQVQLSSW
jgi:hypothetical protein